MIDPLVSGPPTVPTPPPPARPAADRSKVKRDIHRWARLTHVYTSMIALVLILFFGLSGITLNHPDWTFGDAVSTRNDSGPLPFDPIAADGSVDLLGISEFARSDLGANGSVDSYDVVNGIAGIVYKNPGYSADLFVDLEANTYEFSVEQQGWVGVMNDLHKGRDTGTSWSWLIDVSGAILVVVSITGLAMQFFLRKRRRSALVSASVGGLIALVLVIWAVA